MLIYFWGEMFIFLDENDYILGGNVYLFFE